MIEKQDNIQTLSALGSTNTQIRRIFILEGMLIILGGAIIGLMIAIILCLAQQHFGFIRMGQSDGSFIIDAYPVIIQWTDILYILGTVLLLGILSVYWATRRTPLNVNKDTRQ
jgi:ABC-type lipoprotein release transport system permease subunit